VDRRRSWSIRGRPGRRRDLFALERAEAFPERGSAAGVAVAGAAFLAARLLAPPLSTAGAPLLQPRLSAYIDAQCLGARARRRRSRITGPCRCCSTSTDLPRVPFKPPRFDGSPL
jgi:hypothetical protein